MDDLRERVSYESIPLDAIDPDPNNPRKKFPDLEGLAQGFEANFINPHEPFNPPIVVPDGDRWRLVDGECRWRAMVLAGKVRRCHALVCRDVGAAEAVLAMLATDDKRRLTDDERDRGVQLALRLGVKPASVEKAAGMGRGSGRRILAGMRAAGAREYRQQTTEAYLLTLEHQGDEEILDLIAGYEGDALGWEIGQVIARRERAAALAAVEAVLDRAGVERGGKVPAGFRLVDEVLPRGDLAGLADRVADRVAGGRAAFALLPSDADKIGCMGVSLYSAPDPGTPLPPGANAAGRAHSAAKRRRAEWVSRRLLDDNWDSALPNLCALARGWAAGEGALRAGEFFHRAGIPAPEGFGGLCPLVVAMAWPDLDGATIPAAADLAAGARDGASSQLSRAGLDEAARRYAALLTALAGDGYEPDESEERLLAACRARAAGDGDE